MKWSSRRTNSRRGIMPKVDSSVCIWTSTLNTSIPSPCNKAVANGMIVGFVVRKSSFMVVV